MEYDVIIIGGGPSGMTAGIYATRAGAKTLLIEKAGVGGQVAITNSIANYPGFKNVDGFTLSQNMFEQMTELGVETVFASVDKVSLSGKIKEVVAGGVTYQAKSIILSMGAYSRGLGVPNEKKFVGKGLSYCAVCDGAFFKDQTVAVVGGGNTALGDVLYLAPIVKKLYLIHRRQGFRADDATLKKLDELLGSEQNNIELKLDRVAVEIVGTDKVEGLVLRNVVSNETETLPLSGVFVAIGRNPNTEMLDGTVTLDNGYIVVNEQMETNLAGVYAAGDITKKSLRQIATAISDGAIAGTNAAMYAKKSRG